MMPTEAGQLHLWAFLQGIGHYPAGWRYRGATPAAVFSLAYYEEIGRLIERGYFDAIVFGDQLQSRGANGHCPARLAIPTLDPITLLSAIASVTCHVGLVATVSTTYNEPAEIADKFASLDLLSGGRAGWNIVTTAHPASAWNFGADALPAKSSRYARADEFVTVATALWDAAKPRGGGTNDAVSHRGDWFTVHERRLVTPRPTQGRPVLVQAGQSAGGRDFAAKTAEAIFCPAKTMQDGIEFRSDMHARLAARGRRPGDVKIMPGLSFVLGSSEAEARRKDEELLDLASTELCLEYLGESVGYDLAGHPQDGPIPLDAILSGCEFPPTDIKRMLEPAVRRGTPLASYARDYVRTPRGHHVFSGTPEQLADMMQTWLLAGACDGFTLQPAYMPGELELFVGEVVPILQHRGVLRESYAGTTLRGNLGLAAR